MFGSTFHRQPCLLPGVCCQRPAIPNNEQRNRQPELVAGFGAAIELDNVMESWKRKIYEMRWESIRESENYLTTNSHQPQRDAIDSGEWCPDNRAIVYSGVQSCTKSGLLHVELKLWVSYCSGILPDIRGTSEGLLGTLATTPFRSRRSRQSRRGFADGFS